MRSSTRQNSVKPGDNPVQKQEKKTARNPVKPSKTLDFVNRCLNQCWMELTFFFNWAFGFIRFYWGLLGWNEYYWASLSFHRFLPSFTGFYWILMGFTGFY